ncbi:hypothetical protein LRS10_00600 [Phenylobacterium sp. J426]|uniref:hypothetical protein n=1 Tax=Phenylobacterium sp. J426 TaxID=2898439 RepID=UPI002151408A|nr:hypothetical protein [Phenylobacterium sp. J426]MCR5872819.1 hypothetical protein [Phenylobacterium sp. J426]
MRVPTIAALAVLIWGAAEAPGQAQPASERQPSWTIQCVDVSGDVVPARCNVPASRVDQSEFICSCPAGGMRTRVPICGPGEKPPPENLALNRVRRDGYRDGTLEGDKVAGRQICVAPRRS